MLHDPMLDHPVNSLAGLRAWLARQDPEQTYQWECADKCLIGRYLTARLGEPKGHTPGHRYITASERYLSFSMEAYGSRDSAPASFACLRPHTYGAALARFDAQYP